MERVVTGLTGWIVKALRYALNQFMRIDQYVHQTFNQASHNNQVVRSTIKYDMVSAPDEAYYADQYWRHIYTFLREEAVDPKGSFLDIGCGQGRITIPLAERWCDSAGKITGIDLSGHAIDQANAYAMQSNLSNLEFIVADMFEYMRAIPGHSLDGIFCLEVFFFLPQYEQALDEMVRILKPGGVLLVSFRSQYFNLLNIMQQGLWHSVDTILTQQVGRIRGGEVNYAWHTVPQIRQLLEERLNCIIKLITGVGVCSGIPGDPHSAIVRPSTLTKEEKATLMRAELDLGERIPESGRYILVGALTKDDRNIS